MARQGLTFVVVIVATMVAMASAASPITFVFGDSLTEVGNNNYLQYSLAKANFPWYGVDYNGGQPTGRFTNGRTIGDIISSKLGIPPPPPYLSLSQNDDKMLKGVNYASGGAGILNETGLYFIQRMSFDDQINCFEKTKVAIKAKIGEQAADKLLNEAFYLIGLGSNDYVNNFLQPFLADGQQYTHDEFIELLISTLDKQFRHHLQADGALIWCSAAPNLYFSNSNKESPLSSPWSPEHLVLCNHEPLKIMHPMVQQPTRLHQLGARRMVFHGLGPLGCIPSQRVKSKKGDCLKQVNMWVQQFNSRVQKNLLFLNRWLPAAQLIFADTYPAVLDLITNPTAYGFKISNTSCCNVDTNIGGLCLPNSKMCKNRREYVFWDAFHPTDAANAILADRLFSTLFSHPPSPAPAPSRH